MNTCGGCYLDTQINDYRQQKLQAARELAKSMAVSAGQTVGIYKVLFDYKIIIAINAEGLDIVEYISKYQ